MKRFNRIISTIVASALIVGCMVGCGSTNTAESTTEATEAVAAAETTEAQVEEVVESATKEDADESTGDDKIEIVTTIFPEYDWVKAVLGDNPANAEVTMLLDNGVDLHSYQPTADDIIKISTCDMFVYVGGESDEWVEDVLASAENKDMKVINLMDILSDLVKEEEVVEGMESEHHHDDEDEDEHEDADHDEEEHEDADHDEHEEEEVEYDEHLWLSLKNAVVLMYYLEDAISTIDTANADVYKKNTEDYIAQLEDLDKQYEEVVLASSVNTILFGDRFPFRYFADDYKLKYYAAFTGCSAESEASFETITFLASKVDELSLKTVLTIEGDNHKIAETIVENTKTKDQKILTMDSMQSVTSSDVEAGKTYLSIMQDNLEVLEEALK
jgi:zinc transport system substrate-binding protein